MNLFIVFFILSQINSQFPNFNNTNNNGQTNNQTASLNTTNNLSNTGNFDNNNAQYNQQSPKFQNFSANVNQLALSPLTLQPHLDFDFSPHDTCTWRSYAYYWNCVAANPFTNCPWRLWTTLICVKTHKWNCMQQCINF